MARVNIDILGVSKLKWTGMCEFNSDNHYIYYRGQDSLSIILCPRCIHIAGIGKKKMSFLWLSCIQNRSVAQSCPTLCDTMNRSTPGLPVQHQLPEFTQTHVHRVSDAIQPSHPLSSPSPFSPNPSQHQSFPMSQLFG